MEVPIELPLDADGFIRRECPTCEREFKWHNGRTDDTPAEFIFPDVYWCPLCGKSAAHDQWFTQPQVRYMAEVREVVLRQVVDQSMRDMARKSKFLTFKPSGHRPDEPDPLVELDDMVMIAPPCHPWEPVKVPEQEAGPFFCLVCGSEYAV